VKWNDIEHDIEHVSVGLDLGRSSAGCITVSVTLPQGGAPTGPLEGADPPRCREPRALRSSRALHSSMAS
jgi:hypothetical protein